VTTVLSLAAARLRESAPYRALLDGARAARRLPTPAAAWVAERLAEDTGRPLLVVAPHESDALAWAQAARLGATAERVAADRVAEDRVAVFPAPALTPYQAGGVALHVATQEVEALDRLLAGQVTTLVTTVRGLFSRLPTPEVFRALRSLVGPRSIATCCSPTCCAAGTRASTWSRPSVRSRFGEECSISFRWEPRSRCASSSSVT
jgi:hypothetical protein